MALNSGLEFSRGLIQSFLQAKQFELYERREKRYGDQLSANRLYRTQQAAATESRFARTEERLTASAESLTALRGRPRTGTKEHFESLGYGSETAQRLQDQAAGLISKPITAYQRVTAGRIMMESGLTTDIVNAGRQIMEDAMKELQGQNSAFPSRSGGIGPEGTTQLETPSPISSGVFQPRTPDTGATILGGTATQDFLPPESNFGVFDRVNQLDQRIEVRDKDGNLFTIPKSQLEQALTEGFELVEK